MLRSLYSGISGLRAHETMMDVVGNNIANVNTVGYKQSSTLFEDTLSQEMRAAAAPTNTAGGVNPAQVGLGVQLGGIQTSFTQGSTETTNNATDVMIQGDGFFVLRGGGQQVYTRAGAFTFDTNGDLVNNPGMYVMGYSATNGVVNTAGGLSKINIPSGTTIPPQASTSGTISGNIDAANTQVLTESVTAYDSTGAAHNLTMTLTPANPVTVPMTYGYSLADANDATIVPVTGTITFGAAGQSDPTANPSITLADGTAVLVDMTTVTNYAGSSSIGTTRETGYASGTLQSIQIGSDGVITGVFSNQQKLSLGQLALANFNNPDGLQKVGNTSFSATANSGIPQIGVPSNGGRGTLVAGSLEMSNVDLAQEFTNLIIAQRGFQANSKVITSADDMLQDLVNLKR